MKKILLFLLLCATAFAQTSVGPVDTNPIADQTIRGGFNLINILGGGFKVTNTFASPADASLTLTMNSSAQGQINYLEPAGSISTAVVFNPGGSIALNPKSGGADDGGHGVVLNNSGLFIAGHFTDGNSITLSAGNLSVSGSGPSGNPILTLGSTGVEGVIQSVPQSGGGSYTLHFPNTGLTNSINFPNSSGTLASIVGGVLTTSNLTLSAITGSTQCLHVNTSGVISGTGSDCSAVAGTSGGIPYFSSASTQGSSAALTANVLIKGGGVGVAPSSSLLLDSGTSLSYNTNKMTIDATAGDMILTGSLTTGGGSTAGSVMLPGNATPPTLITNTSALIGPNGTVTTPYGLQMPVTGPSAAGVVLVGAPSSNISQISYSNGPLATSLGGTGFNDLTLSGSTHKLASVLGTLSTGAVANFDASGNIVAGSLIDNGQITTNENLDVVNQGVMFEVPNAGTTGTSIAHLTKLTGAPSTALIAAITDTSGIIGITEIETAGGTSGVTTGNAGIIRLGQTACAFDAATTAGNYVQISPTIAGDCHDSGVAPPSYPSSGQVLGRVLSTNGSAGTYQIVATGVEVQANPNTGSAGALTIYGNPSTSSGSPSFTTNPVTNTVSTGTPPACDPGTGGGMCNVEGTAFTNAPGSDGFYADSTAHEYVVKTNGASSGGLLHRSQPGAIHQTAQTASIGTATLCAASAGACNVAGEYQVHWNFIETGTACSNVTAGSVNFQLTWTDSNGTAHSAVVLPMGNQTGATSVATGNAFTFATALANAGASGNFNISTNGTVIQYATTYVACTTGTGTYQLDAAMTRLQ